MSQSTCGALVLEVGAKTKTVKCAVKGLTSNCLRKYPEKCKNKAESKQTERSC